MAKDLRFAMLLDFYGGLLTEKQVSAMDMYYNQDMSLTEIADEMSISRQGAQAFLKLGEAKLIKYEDRLGLVSRFERITSCIGDINTIVSDMPQNDEINRIAVLIKEISEYL